MIAQRFASSSEQSYWPRIYDWVLARAKQLDDPGTNYEITIDGE